MSRASPIIRDAVSVAECDVDNPATALIEREDCFLHLRGDRLRVVELALIVDHFCGNDAHWACESIGTDAFTEIADRCDACTLSAVAPYIGGAEALRNADRILQRRRQQGMLGAATIDNADQGGVIVRMGRLRKVGQCHDWRIALAKVWNWRKVHAGDQRKREDVPEQ